MHIHNEISRLVEADDFSRIDLQDVAFASDFLVVTRDMTIIPVEPVEKPAAAASDSRLPTGTGTGPRGFFVHVTGKDPSGKSITIKITGKTESEVLKQLKVFNPATNKGITYSKLQEEI